MSNNFTLMTKRIGSTIYNTKIYFSDTASETLEDKILRNIRNEVLENTADCSIIKLPQMSRPV